MSDERWTVVDRLLGAALERAPEERAAFLNEACAGDEALRHDVESLLEHHAGAGHFLESPGVELLKASPTAESGAQFVDRQLGPYRILSLLGIGGMGEVYRARDTKLARDVAIKVLRADVLRDGDRRRRFIREARAASALNHPNIVTVHDIQHSEGIDFIVMEYVRGKSLRDVIPEGGLPVDLVAEYGAQIASAMQAAHAAGIIHRDIKPINVVVSETNRVKVLDFGLAKLVGPPAGVTDVTATATLATGVGSVLGTPAYMSPEQAQGHPVNEKSDIFSFGILLYEMLVGRRPFSGDTPMATLTAIVGQRQPPLKSLRAHLPADLERLTDSCLEKNPIARPSADDIVRELEQIRHIRPAPITLRHVLRRPSIAVPLVGFLAAVLGISYWWWADAARVRWARGVALPEIQRLEDQSDYDGAFRLARTALESLPDDPMVKQLWINVTIPATIRSEPAGAEVAMRGYGSTNATWFVLGRTPLENIRVPFGPLRLRISREGFATIEVSSGGALILGPGVTYRLDETRDVPSGMVRVQAGPARFANTDTALSDYWIDRLEVTNRQFKEFVDSGGYRKEEYWREPFLLDGQPLSRDEAMARFVDATGRPGPSTWELETYPEGQADFPVTGVSWYEAAAYAAFAGKSLPTVFHWTRAAGRSPVVDIVGASNLYGKGPATAGRYGGLGPFGTYDMAGNVKEWTWNQVGSRRVTLGNAWNESSYDWVAADPHTPFERQANIGFRCVKYVQQPAVMVADPIPSQKLEYYDMGKEVPVGDDIFRAFQAHYRYDPRPLNASVDNAEDTPQWRKEPVSFDAGYGTERVKAYLLLPKNVASPFQVVVGFPGGEAFASRSSRELSLRFIDFVIRSGRAVMLPVYKGTYERGPSATSAEPNAMRDQVITWSKDLGRSIDYLETRADIDRNRIAYYGVSAGADAGLVITALEPRLRASVLQAGGPVLDGSQSAQHPEMHFVNFVPRIRVPTLLLYGQNDAGYPVNYQRELFRRLGAEHKDYTALPGGHTPARQQDVIKEVLDWFDKHLGKVPPRQ